MTSGRRDITFRRLLKTHLFRKSFPDYLLDINWLSPVDLVVVLQLRPPKNCLTEWLIWMNAESEPAGRLSVTAFYCYIQHTSIGNGDRPNNQSNKLYGKFVIHVTQTDACVIVTCDLHRAQCTTTKQYSVAFSWNHVAMLNAWMQPCNDNTALQLCLITTFTLQRFAQTDSRTCIYMLPSTPRWLYCPSIYMTQDVCYHRCESIRFYGSINLQYLECIFMNNLFSKSKTK